VIKCKDCNHLHPIYFSCGHSRCPICSAIKREQWMDKFSARLLGVPYVHLVTTLPHYFNSLARRYPREIYNVLFRATKKTVWKLYSNPDHLGATPGMTSVQHTWGSDMNYHVHIHSLLTFGVDKNIIEIRESYDAYIAPIKDRRWSIFVTHPTMSTEVIEKYLARYINRIAISNRRVEYVKHLKKVNIIYNDYKRQQEGEPAPKERKTVLPLSFIHQLLVHLPPPYFQRTRHYGLHANAKSEKTKRLISIKARNHPRAIRTVMEIITHLMKLKPFACQECGSENFTTHDLRPDAQWIFQYITLPKIRSPVSV